MVGSPLDGARRPWPGRKGQTPVCPRLAVLASGTRGAIGVPLPPAAVGLRRFMPTDPIPQPFGGFRPCLALSKDEVLDVIATLEQVIEDLADRELLDTAEELARVRDHLVSRLGR